MNGIHKEAILYLYSKGIFATSSPFSPFVHEFGHAINHYYAMEQNYRNILNLNIIDKKNGSETIEEKIIYHFATKFSSIKFNIFNRFDSNNVVDESVDLIFKKIEPDKKMRKKSKYLNFAKWVAIPSHYGRKQLDDPLQKNGEWFAEDFAYYYLTPHAERNQVWEFWHQLFTKDLQKIFNR